MSNAFAFWTAPKTQPKDRDRLPSVYQYEYEQELKASRAKKTKRKRCFTRTIKTGLTAAQEKDLTDLKAIIIGMRWCSCAEAAERRGRTVEWVASTMNQTYVDKWIKEAHRTYLESHGKPHREKIITEFAGGLRMMETGLSGRQASEAMGGSSAWMSSKTRHRWMPKHLVEKYQQLAKQK